jgi:hypothetical protein
MPGAYDPTALEISDAPPPAGAIPTRPLRARRGLFGLSPRATFLGGLGLALTLAVIVGLTLAVVFAPLTSGWLASVPVPGAATPTPTPVPTATPMPTPLPVLSYEASTPGPGCGGSDWIGADGQAASDAQCTTAGLLLTNPANASAITSVYWDGLDRPTTYAVRVTVTNLANACAGIGFAGDGRRAYVGYVCSSGAWNVIRYDVTGAPIVVDRGSVGQQNAYLIHLSVAQGAFQFHVGGATVYDGAIEDGYDTQAISLALESLSQNQAGRGYFRDFVYGA